jgi:hypothetical protein
MSADTAGGRRLESVLQKKGHSRKNWKTRTVTWEPETKTAVYFIVAKSKQIPEGVRKEKGRLVIESVVDIPDRNKKRLFRFNLVGGGAALELCAASQQEKEAWLRTVAEDTDEVKKVLGQREQQYATEMEAKKLEHSQALAMLRGEHVSDRNKLAKLHVDKHNALLSKREEQHADALTALQELQGREFQEQNQQQEAAHAEVLEQAAAEQAGALEALRLEALERQAQAVSEQERLVAQRLKAEADEQLAQQRTAHRSAADQADAEHAARLSAREEELRTDALRAARQKSFLFGETMSSAIDEVKTAQGQARAEELQGLQAAHEEALAVAVTSLQVRGTGERRRERDGESGGGREGD